VILRVRGRREESTQIRHFATQYGDCIAELLMELEETT